MATINYTRTQLDSRHVLVDWSSLSPGDDGQAFDALGFELLSITGGLGNLGQSNALSAPSGLGTPGVTDMGALFKPTVTTRWYQPWRPNGAGSAMNFSALFRVI